MATQQPSKLSKAKARLMIEHPFFASLAMRTEMVLTHDVELAATDGSHCYFNPDFVDECSVEDIMCVIAHEVGGHDALLHSLRMGARDPDMWNIACDHAINNMLQDQGFKCPKSVPGGWLCDPQYKGWAADKIYDDLYKKRSKQPQGGQGQGQSGKPGKQNGKGGKPGPQQPGRDWLHGDILPSKARTEAEKAAAAQKARQRVASAATMARMAGKLTGDLARMVDEMLAGKVPWSDVLRNHMLKVVKSRDDWTRPNRRYPDVYLPIRRSRRMGPIIFIPDTSGSIFGTEEMKQVCSEMAHCAVQTKPESIRVLWSDTQVKGEQEFTANDFEFSALKPVGGGGTDMRVPLRYAEQYDPQVVVLLTDGYTPWPDVEPPFPLIVLCTTNVRCPVGEVIRI